MIRAGARWRLGRSCERRCGLSPWFGWVCGEGRKGRGDGGECRNCCLVVKTRRAEAQIQLLKIKLNDIPIPLKHPRNRTKCDILVPAVRAGSEEKKNGMKSTAPKAQRITLIYGRISLLHKLLTSRSDVQRIQIASGTSFDSLSLSARTSLWLSQDGYSWIGSSHGAIVRK